MYLIILSILSLAWEHKPTQKPLMCIADLSWFIQQLTHMRLCICSTVCAPTHTIFTVCYIQYKHIKKMQRSLLLFVAELYPRGSHTVNRSDMPLITALPQGIPTSNSVSAVNTLWILNMHSKSEMHSAFKETYWPPFSIISSRWICVH